jgi:hypothetical protein
VGDAQSGTRTEIAEHRQKIPQPIAGVIGSCASEDDLLR